MPDGQRPMLYERRMGQEDQESDRPIHGRIHLPFRANPRGTMARHLRDGTPARVHLELSLERPPPNQMGETHILACRFGACIPVSLTSLRSNVSFGFQSPRSVRAKNPDGTVLAVWTVAVL